MVICDVEGHRTIDPCSSHLNKHPLPRTPHPAGEQMEHVTSTKLHLTWSRGACVISPVLLLCRLAYSDIFAFTASSPGLKYLAPRVSANTPQAIRSRFPMWWIMKPPVFSRSRRVHNASSLVLASGDARAANLILTLFTS